MNKFGIIIKNIERIIIIEFDPLGATEWQPGFYELSKRALVNKWNYVDDIIYHQFNIHPPEVFDTLNKAREETIVRIFND